MCCVVGTILTQQLSGNVCIHVSISLSNCVGTGQRSNVKRRLIQCIWWVFFWGGVVVGLGGIYMSRPNVISTCNRVGYDKRSMKTGGRFGDGGGGSVFIIVKSKLYVYRYIQG